MTAATLRTLGSFAAQKGDLASPLSPWREGPHPPGSSQAKEGKETNSLCLLQVHLRPRPPSHLLLQEVMRSPSIVAKPLPVAASPHRKMVTRSKSCEGIAVVPEQASR